MLLFASLANAQYSRVEIPLRLEEAALNNTTFIRHVRPVRPKIAIALSGGGARGLAQIGVLKVFEREGLPIDGIVGTSMGAVIGGLYAVGYTAARIESLAKHIDWDEIIQDAPPRQQLFLGQKVNRYRHIVQFRVKGLRLEIPMAYTSGQRLTTLITDLMLNAPHPLSGDFDELFIPFRALATDLLTGKKVVLKSGSLIEALRSSMAIPLLFTPVQNGGTMLVDGGLVQNLPVSEAESLGADIVIAVDTSSKLRDKNGLTAPWQIVDQVTTIMQQENVQSELRSADVAIKPRLERISNTAFDQINEIIEAGMAATENVLPRIVAMISSEPDSQTDVAFSVDTVIVEGCQHICPDSLSERIHIQPGSRVPVSRIRWASHSLLQTGYFEDLHAFVDTVGHHLIFQVRENPMIRRIVLEGNQTISDSALFSRMEMQPGKVLNIQESRHDVNAMLNAYYTLGFSLARIDSLTLKQGSLSVHFNEGRIGRILLEGNKRTRSFVILREMPMKPGDLFSVPLLKQGIENIYSTQCFESVRFSLEPRSRLTDLVLNLEEKEHTHLRMGIRYDLERRTQGFLNLVEENLLGYGDRGSLMGLVGNRDMMLEAKTRSDRLFNTYMTYEIRAAYEKREYKTFENLSRTGQYNKSAFILCARVGQQMRRLGTLSIQLQSETFKLDPGKDMAGPDEQGTIQSFIMRSEVDTRDRIPFPHQGKHHMLEYEISPGFLGNKYRFFRLYSSMEMFYPLFTNMLFHPRIRWGTSDLNNPFVRQFRMGGLDSFMGLPEEAQIGKRYFILNGELRYRIPWPRWAEAYISVRYDFGATWGKFENIKKDDFKQGIGAVLSVNTPLGPVRFGYGHMSEGLGQIYFSAGYRF